MTNERTMLPPPDRGATLDWADIPEHVRSGLSASSGRSLAFPGRISPATWRWAESRARPNYQHRSALYEMAGSIGPGHLFTE